MKEIKHYDYQHSSTIVLAGNLPWLINILREVRKPFNCKNYFIESHVCLTKMTKRFTDALKYYKWEIIYKKHFANCLIICR